MTFLTDGVRSSSDGLDDAVRRLYAACHLRKPLVVTARNATEFARICAALLARTGHRRSLDVIPLSFLSFTFAINMAIVIKGFAGEADRIGQVLDAGSALTLIAVLFSVPIIPFEMGNRRSE